MRVKECVKRGKEYVKREKGVRREKWDGYCVKKRMRVCEERKGVCM